jgi:hypothetical protein
MSAGHTPGRMKAGNRSVSIPESEDRLGLEAKFYGGSALDHKANARRMAACWNACEDEDTVMLEAIVREGTTIRKRHDEALRRAERCMGELNAMERQRDELLALLMPVDESVRSRADIKLGDSVSAKALALIEQRDELLVAANAAYDAMTDERADEAYKAEAARNLLAAIAKVKGGAA